MTVFTAASLTGLAAVLTIAFCGALSYRRQTRKYIEELDRAGRDLDKSVDAFTRQLREINEKLAAACHDSVEPQQNAGAAPFSSPGNNTDN